MSKHVLFMVHGMGEQEKGWEKPAVSELRKAWNSAGLDEYFGHTFDYYYEVVPYRYSNEFIDFWNRYRENAQYLKKLKLAGAPSIIRALYDVAKSTSGLDSNIITHWTDVFLYAASAYNEKIPQELILHLRKQGFDNYSIIAHSLGTRVMHDALQRGYSTGDDDYQLFGTPTVVLSAANVTRLMSGNTGEFKGERYKVFPSTILGEGCCWHYLTTHHWLDVIGSIRPFKIHPSDISTAFTSANYISKPLPPIDLRPGTRLNTLSNFLSDVHSLRNHLAHPAVYVPFFNRTLRPSINDTPLVSDAKKNQLLAEYRKAIPTGQLLQHFKTIRSELREVRHETFAQRVKSIKAVQDELEKLRTTLKSLPAQGG